MHRKATEGDYIDLQGSMPSVNIRGNIAVVSFRGEKFVRPTLATRYGPHPEFRCTADALLDTVLLESKGGTVEFQTRYLVRFWQPEGITKSRLTSQIPRRRLARRISADAIVIVKGPEDNK